MFSKKTKKVFLGTVDIAGQIGSYQQGYESNGYRVFSFVNDRSKSFKTKYNFVYFSLYPNWLLTNNRLAILRKIYTLIIVRPIYWILMLWAILSCDIFHFMWFLPKENVFILWILRKMKKRIIISFVGSDIRWYPLWVAEFDERSLTYPDFDVLMKLAKDLQVTLDKQLRNCRIFEKYADVIISVPEQSQLLLRPYFNFYLPLDLDKIKFKLAKNKRIKVAIGVTGAAKNSETVLDAVQRLQKRRLNDFDVILLINMQHEDILKELSESDIFIYTPYGCGTGRFGMEAIASGTLCMCGYDEKWYNIPSGLPVVPITESDFLLKLESYIDNHEARESLILAGKSWIEKYADPKWIVKDILKKLENPDKKYDYIPAYFRDKAKFDSEGNPPDAADQCNKWTTYVKDCDWYKKHVPLGTRDGLIF